MNSGTSDSPEEPDRTPLGGESIGGFAYGLGLSLAVLAIFMIITYASYKCKRRPTTTTLHHRRSAAGADADYSSSSPSVDVVVNIQHVNGSGGGLDEATISSYPHYKFSQIKPHKNPGVAVTCAICLADYKESDVLRLLPECGHIFHLKCVDPWLMLHPTCPVCRNPPPRAPTTPLVQPAPVAAQ